MRWFRWATFWLAFLTAPAVAYWIRLLPSTDLVRAMVYAAELIGLHVLYNHTRRVTQTLPGDDLKPAFETQQAAAE